MASEVTEPATDEEIRALREAIQAQRVEVREHLASELGGVPADYDADRYIEALADESTPDGGDGPA